MNEKTKMLGRIGIFLTFSFFLAPSLVAAMHDIDELKKHNETRDQRLKRKDPALYKDLFLSSKDVKKRAKRLHVITLEKAQQLLSLFQERLLPAHPDESKKDQIERTRRLTTNSMSALKVLCSKLEKEWSLDIAYALYKIGFAFAAFPHDEKAESLRTLAVRNDFDSAFFALYGLNCFIKRMKGWDYADDRSILIKVKDKVKFYIHTLTQPSESELEAA